MRTIILLLVLLPLASVAVSAQLDEETIGRIRLELAVRDSIDLQDLIEEDSSLGRMFRHRTVDEIIRSVRYVGTIASPLQRSSFHEFASSALGTPDRYFAFVCTDTTHRLIPRDTSYLNSDEIGIINHALELEPRLDRRQLLQLVRTLNALADAGHRQQILLTSWADIVLAPSEQLPRHLVKTIHAPRVSHRRTGDELTFWVWDKGTTALRKFTVNYARQRISLSYETHGHFGERQIVL